MSYSVISIPYSSIKSPKSPNLIIVLPVFQFLIVRLKADSSIQIKFPYVISIPYSSIKSVKKERREHSLEEISIPYSSIKRDGVGHFREPSVAFQFLIVRLKEVGDEEGHVLCS